jgi:hypothetical protein
MKMPVRFSPVEALFSESGEKTRLPMAGRGNVFSSGEV